MLWIKALHLIFVASWFAGLFYLPRIFVNLASVPADSHAERERLLLMARRLHRFSGLLMLVALALGLTLWLGFGIGLGADNGWMHAKLVLVVAAVGYHHACGSLLRKFEKLGQRAQRALVSGLQRGLGADLRIDRHPRDRQAILKIEADRSPRTWPSSKQKPGIAARRFR